MEPVKLDAMNFCSLYIIITTPMHAGVTIQKKEVIVQVPEGNIVITVCADLTGQLERDIVVQLATTTLEGFKGAGVYSFGEDTLIPCMGVYNCM